MKCLLFGNNVNLFYHLDRRNWKASDAYIELCSGHPEIKISITENGHRYENAIAEKIRGILKHKLELDQLIQTMR